MIVRGILIFYRLAFPRRGALLGVFGCLAVVGFAIPTTAAAEVTSLTSCQSITAPGKYRLDANISSASGCIAISASDVTLILNGHSITSLGRSPFGIFVALSASRAKIMGPGTVTGFVQGIELDGGNASVRGVTTTGNFGGIGMGSAGNSIRGNVANDNSSFGISVFQGTGNTIVGNSAHGNSFLDLFDENGNCTTNVWKGNDFGSAFPSCIQ